MAKFKLQVLRSAKSQTDNLKPPAPKSVRSRTDNPKLQDLKSARSQMANLKLLQKSNVKLPLLPVSLAI
jgi:hypothetical protein